MPWSCEIILDVFQAERFLPADTVPDPSQDQCLSCKKKTYRAHGQISILVSLTDAYARVNLLLCGGIVFVFVFVSLDPS